MGYERTRLYVNVEFVNTGTIPNEGSRGSTCMLTVYLINESTTLDDEEIQNMLPALQEQVTRDFAPLWGIDATLELNPREQVEGAYRIRLLDHCDNPADLGYHLNQDGIPTAECGVGDAAGANVEVSTIISHELLEMLADPVVTRMSDKIGSDTYVVEVCDPVSEDYYRIGNVTVANFVTPRYYGLAEVGQYDQLNLLDAGCPSVRPGGYTMHWNGQSWLTTFGRHVDGKVPWRITHRGRSHLRSKADPIAHKETLG